MIKNIIGNDVYCGTLRTHKKKTISIRGKAIKLPESEHFVFENHHEAIVSKETFQSANDIRNRRATMNRQCGKPKRNYFFGGLCRCAECGMSASGMVLRRKITLRLMNVMIIRNMELKDVKDMKFLKKICGFNLKIFKEY